MTYDVSNRLASITFFDTHDRIITPGNLGYARREISYSPDGAPDERVFDAHGQRLYRSDPTGFLPGWRTTPFAGQKNRTVVVTGVMADSQAERAGVRPGDVVVSYNGAPIDSAEKLRSLTNAGLGYRKLQVQRDGKTITMDVSMGPLGLQLTEK
jgi:S1-C subfamily serine protease